ncbi:S-adenosyl-L-homocysteine hydrolase [Novosphingobium sp. BL-52-GroH]|uniref:S-adenosyl-L-homocysteine hydrolase n=1 Tax=Novosphingobium sp. BL-52-GroH TaxID=3349877 RepID=UPI00384CD1FF
MRIFEHKGHKWFSAAAGAVGCIAMAMPANAAEGDAQKLRRMDIMLMVTGLRCRTTADNFIEDYGRFTSSHMTELNEANHELRTQLAAEAGEEGAERALDRMSVVMANEYGGGHPWLTCHDLRQVAQSLALVKGRDTLVEAAGQLLERQPRPLLALAGR